MAKVLVLNNFDSSRKKRTKSIINKIIIQVLLIGFSLAFIFPFMWMVSVSLKTPNDLTMSDSFFKLLIPSTFHYQNYSTVIKEIDFIRLFFNSLSIAAIAVIATIVSGSMCAYSFSKLKYPGRKIFINVLIASMIMPGFIFIIPLYKIYSKLGFIDTWLPLILPSILGGGAGNIYLIMQFFATVPNDLNEAAKIDGAGNFRIWVQIMIPLCKPVIASVAIFAFLFSWNDYLNPSIYINRHEINTLVIGLKSFQGRSGTQWGPLMAGSLLSMVPMLIIFIACQKYFVEGIKMSGIKS